MITSTPTSRPATTEALLAELRELSRDVTGDVTARHRRLVVLRRLEQAAQDDERPPALLISA